MCQLQTQLWKHCIQSELAQSTDTLYPRTNFSDLAVNRMALTTLCSTMKLVLELMLMMGALLVTMTMILTSRRKRTCRLLGELLIRRDKINPILRKSD